MSFDASTPSGATWRIDISHVFGLYQENVIEYEAVRRKRYTPGSWHFKFAIRRNATGKSRLLHPLRSSVILAASRPQFDAEIVPENAICSAFSQKRRVSKQV